MLNTLYSRFSSKPSLGTPRYAGITEPLRTIYRAPMFNNFVSRATMFDMVIENECESCVTVACERHETTSFGGRREIFQLKIFRFPLFSRREYSHSVIIFRGYSNYFSF